jgi:hypothetical protein
LESADGHERGVGSVGSAPSLAAKGSSASENAKTTKEKVR